MIKPGIKRITYIASVAILVGVLGTAIFIGNRKPPATKTTVPAAQRPALAVITVQAQTHDWPILLAANGTIAAWQEAVVGSELNGVRLSEVSANVGDVVRRGQVLAHFTSDTIAANILQQDAEVEEAASALAEAQANAQRARTLIASGMLSHQQTGQYLTLERSAKARLNSARARRVADQIRLRQSRVLAPDDGIISARSATTGAVAQQGTELFRLIRKGRLEWRAEVPSSELLLIKPGQTVHLRGVNGVQVEGKVRAIAPNADVQTRHAMVYVDLPANPKLHGGMFATGQFELGRSTALTIPHSAVVTRDGYDYVYQLVANNRVQQTRVKLGRRLEQSIEVLSGLSPSMKLVGQSGSFLADGDLVSVVSAPPPIPAIPQ